MVPKAPNQRAAGPRQARRPAVQSGEGLTAERHRRRRLTSAGFWFLVSGCPPKRARLRSWLRPSSLQGSKPSSPPLSCAVPQDSRLPLLKTRPPSPRRPHAERLPGECAHCDKESVTHMCCTMCPFFAIWTAVASRPARRPAVQSGDAHPRMPPLHTPRALLPMAVGVREAPKDVNSSNNLHELPPKHTPRLPNRFMFLLPQMELTNCTMWPVFLEFFCSLLRTASPYPTLVEPVFMHIRGSSAREATGSSPPLRPPRRMDRHPPRAFAHAPCRSGGCHGA